MKALYTILLINLIIVTNLHPQSFNDSTLYNPGIRLLEGSTTMDDYKNAASYFEQLASQNSEQWLALYYAGFSYIKASYKAQEDKLKDGLIDIAQPLIDKALILKPEEPELQVLQAFLYQARIQVNPEMRGLNYSLKADGILKKAVAADPVNPRAWSLMAFNIYYTPTAFGGGAKNALPVFIKAKEKFLSFSPLLPFMPTWGEPENQQMIVKCKKVIK